MNRIVVVILGSIILALLAGSCSELKKDLPAPVSSGVQVHGEGWSEPASTGFHGTYLKTTAPPWNAKECERCHGGNSQGGTSGVSCFTCHASYPHAGEWGAQPSSSAFHGRYLKARTPAWDSKECQGCHGADYGGGTSGVACFTCHDSYPHAARFTQAGKYHPGYLQSKNYPLLQCQTCHGAAYTGGAIVNVSCEQSGCHVDRNGAAKSPEACNTCHGDFSSPASVFLSAAPPKSVAGDSATTVRGVGAHQKHLATGTLGKTVKCQECHAVPAKYDAPGHLGAPPADIAFNDTLARLTTGDGTLKPNVSYDAVSGKCGNTYCHGNWRLRKATSPNDFAFTDTVMVGGKASPGWTDGSSAAACGSTCHANPPAGHAAFAITACVNCHGDVVDGTGRIVNKAKHINGKITMTSFYGGEQPFR